MSSEAPWKVVPSWERVISDDRHQDGGADDRPPDRAEAADDGEQQDLDGDDLAEHAARADVEEVLDVEDAAHGAEHAADDVGLDLGPDRVDAQRLGRVLVLAHGLQVVEEALAGLYQVT